MKRRVKTLYAVSNEPNVILGTMGFCEDCLPKTKDFTFKEVKDIPALGCDCTVAGKKINDKQRKYIFNKNEK